MAYITQDQINDWFTYHAPSPNQQIRYVALRDAAKTFAEAIIKNTPEGPDQTVAVRKVREAVMTANAAIACEKPAVAAP